VRMLAVAPLLLAGCGGPPDSEGGREAPSPAGLTRVQRDVVAMADGRRRGVLLRAIRDGGQDCQGVTLTLRQPDADGRPTWAARCQEGSVYQVSIGGDGRAEVAAVAGGSAAAAATAN